MSRTGSACANPRAEQSVCGVKFVSKCDGVPVGNNSLSESYLTHSKRFRTLICPTQDWQISSTPWVFARYKCLKAALDHHFTVANEGWTQFTRKGETSWHPYVREGDSTIEYVKPGTVNLMTHKAEPRTRKYLYPWCLGIGAEPYNFEISHGCRQNIQMAREDYYQRNSAPPCTRRSLLIVHRRSPISWLSLANLPWHVLFCSSLSCPPSAEDTGSENLTVERLFIY